MSLNMNWCYLWMFCGLCFSSVHKANGTFNLYMNSDEVKRILGLSKELYYVREGVPNTYALNFVVTLPVHITAIHLTWETLGQKPLPYSASIESSDSVALHKPSLNISGNGTIPTKSETFTIYMPCTGFRSTEVILEFSLNVTANPKFLANQVTQVVLRRKKVCLEGRPDPPVSSLGIGIASGSGGVSKLGGHSPSVSSSGISNGSNGRKTGNRSHQNGNGNNNNNNRGHVHNPNRDKDKKLSNNFVNNDLKSMEEVFMISTTDVQIPHVSDSSLVYIILGASCGILTILLAIVAAAYLRTRKGSSTTSTGFLTVDTSGKGSSGSGCGSSGSACGSGGGSIFVRSESPHHYSSVSPCLGSGSYTYSSFQPNAHYTEISRSTMDSTSCKLADITVERCKVRLESVIMEGTFAKVYKGTVQEGGDGTQEKVIVKTVVDQSSPVQMALLLHEGLALVGLGQKHIHAVIGVAAEERVPPFLIYPDDGFRNLKRFLQRCRSGPGRPITPQEIVHMAIQIASGIAFLHRQNIFHRDVAARNCVVDDKLLMVKISDGALSRDLFPDDYHWIAEAQTRPVKWLAPESILQPRATISADVWSFGVLIWELTTLAQQPYLEIDHQDLFSFLKLGYRLSQPVNCPDELYSSMSKCWTWDPDDRPKWTHVIPELQSLHSNLAQYV